MTAAIPTPRDEEGYLIGGPTTLQNTWKRIAGSTLGAAGTLIDISKNGRNEMARVSASKVLLELGGFHPGNKVEVRLIPPEYDQSAPTAAHAPPHVQIQQRLDALLAATEAEESEILDAEIVDESD